MLLDQVIHPFALQNIANKSWLLRHYKTVHLLQVQISNTVLLVE